VPRVLGMTGLVVTIPRAPLVGKPAQQRGNVGEEALARRWILRCHLRSQRMSLRPAQQFTTTAAM